MSALGLTMSVYVASGNARTWANWLIGALLPSGFGTAVETVLGDVHQDQRVAEDVGVLGDLGGLVFGEWCRCFVVGRWCGQCSEQDTGREQCCGATVVRVRMDVPLWCCRQSPGSASVRRRVPDRRRPRTLLDRRRYRGFGSMPSLATQ